jgi:hypothetical protein
MGAPDKMFAAGCERKVESLPKADEMKEAMGKVADYIRRRAE